MISMNIDAVDIQSEVGWNTHPYAKNLRYQQ